MIGKNIFNCFHPMFFFLHDVKPQYLRFLVLMFLPFFKASVLSYGESGRL